jgi:hypothetical protein
MQRRVRAMPQQGALQDILALQQHRSELQRQNRHYSVLTATVDSVAVTQELVFEDEFEPQPTSSNALVNVKQTQWTGEQVRKRGVTNTRDEDTGILWLLIIAVW